MSTATDPLLQRDRRPDRNFYGTGVLLDARDFTDEQSYHRGRLARALAYLHGAGTVAGLRVTHQTALAPGEDPNFPEGRDEEIVVSPGLALDRLGRLIELPNPACVRLQRWLDGQDDTTLRVARHRDPFDGIVVDVFIRFALCERGKTPAFATGPFDAIDAALPARVRDWYRLELVARLEHRPDGEPDLPPLPVSPWPSLTGMDEATRRTALQTAIYDSWREGSDQWDNATPRPLPEHVPNQDTTSVFLARVVIPTTVASNGAPRPERDTARPVEIHDASRPFVYPTGALARALEL